MGGGLANVVIRWLKLHEFSEKGFLCSRFYQCLEE